MSAPARGWRNSPVFRSFIIRKALLHRRDGEAGTHSGGLEAYYTEKESYFTGNGVTKDGTYVSVRHILVMPEGGTTGDDGTTTYSDEEWAACEKEGAGDSGRVAGRRRHRGFLRGSGGGKVRGSRLQHQWRPV